MSKFICPDKDDMIIGIKKVSNGFAVQQTMGVDDEVKIDEFVFETKDELIGEDHLNELNSVADLLFHIKDFLGCNYSKHNKKNLQIQIVDQEVD